MKRKLVWTSLSIFLLFPSCVPGDDFEVPAALEPEEVSLQTNSDLKALLGAFYQAPEEMSVVTIEDSLLLEAYVVSSDEAGNFYKELILQDAPENPTAGVALQLNLPSYFETFNFGRKIYLNLKGLSIGELNGVVAVGLSNGKLIEPIPLARIHHHIIRTEETSEIVPLSIKASDFSDRMENLYVRLENVQFSSYYANPETSFTYASENNDEFDGEREVVSCTGDFAFILSTSTFADFKSLRLPSGSGSLQGILTRDFYDEFFTIYLNTPLDLQFSDDSRCDPATLDCGLAQTVGPNLIFQEDFESQKNNSPITGNGWANIVQEGSVEWEGFTATGANASLGRSARVQIPGSGDYRTVSWLITPPIQFDSHSREVLEFKTSTSFGNGSMLEVLFSNTWDGDPDNLKKGSWELLTSAYIARASDFYGDWIPSGKVSLSCAEGKGYIGFRYTGKDQEYYNGIYELDDIIIMAD